MSIKLGAHHSWERFRVAANKIYKTGFPEKRGEIGELILHILCRKYFDTYPSVSKIYYKSSGGEVVKGFDLVHTKYDEDDDEVEFWLGEAKFYKDGSDAVSKAIASVKEHLEMGFLKAEKIAVFNKVIKQAPGYEKIEFMLHVDTSVDELTKRMVIPVLITFDSKSLSGTSELNEEYAESIIAETKLYVDKFLAEQQFEHLEMRLLFVPTDTKQKLLERFDKIIQGVSLTGDL